MLNDEGRAEMAGTIVEYARFLEARRRRQRVVAELTRRSTDTPNPTGTDPDQPPTIDCETSADKQAVAVVCGREPVTRTDK
jgi:hypothetical protein